MPRTPQAVYEAQSQALEAGDLEKLAADYSDTCVQIWNGRVRRGKSGVKEGFGEFLTQLADVKDLGMPVQVFEDNVLYLEWWADLGDRRAEGVDTFVFDDGLITVHTISYDIKPAAPASS